MTGIGMMPDEVLVRILSFLPLHTVRCVAPLVCKRWEHLIKQPDVWYLKPFHCSEGMTMKTSCVPWEKVTTFLKATPVRHMSVSFQHRKHLTGLTSLFIDCPLLKSLRIAMYFDDKFPFRKNALRAAKLSKWITVSQGLIRTLNGLLPNIQQLKITPAELVCVEAILEFPHMKNLRIDTSALSLDLIDKLASSSLTRIDAIENMPTEKKLKALARLPMGCFSLSEGTHVITQTMLTDFFTENSFTRLTELKIVGRHFDNEVAKCIRLNLRSLRSLDVGVKTLRRYHSLTQLGLLHFLHMPYLNIIDIRFLERIYQNYKRDKYEKHDCDASLQCPVGITTLLLSWRVCDIDF